MAQSETRWSLGLHLPSRIRVNYIGSTKDREFAQTFPARYLSGNSNKPRSRSQRGSHSREANEGHLPRGLGQGCCAISRLAAEPFLT